MTLQRKIGAAIVLTAIGAAALTGAPGIHAVRVAGAAAAEATTPSKLGDLTGDSWGFRFAGAPPASVPDGGR